MTVAMAICCVSATAEAFPEDWKQQQQQRSSTVTVKRRKVAGIDQERLVDPWLLADEESRFAEYKGRVQVHYKVGVPKDQLQAQQPGKMHLPAILLHGFGASVFSWERLLSPLAQVLAAPALAFDRPGFGLTSRVFSSTGENPYSMEFSAALTLAFANFLKAEQAILIGHSAGCIVAAEAYLADPARVAAIVMLAPAIVAPLLVPSAAESKPTSPDDQSFLKKLAAAIVARVALLLSFLREAVAAFCCKIITAALRSRAAVWLIRQVMDRFGERVVKSAWCDPANADEYVIRGYTKPLGCRHWEKALLEYVISLVTSSRRSGLKLSQRLHEISCPVLVVTGDCDRLVPAWNARKLAKCFPNSRFHMIQHCGHLPHEEKPDEVLRLIRDFIDSFSAPDPAPAT